MIAIGSSRSSPYCTFPFLQISRYTTLGVDATDFARVRVRLTCSELSVAKLTCRGREVPVCRTREGKQAEVVCERIGGH